MKKEKPYDFYNGIWKEIPKMKNPFSIPHYLIIDKKGDIVNPNAPRPSSKNDLHNEIDKLLQPTKNIAHFAYSANNKDDSNK